MGIRKLVITREVLEWHRQCPKNLPGNPGNAPQAEHYNPLTKVASIRQERWRVEDLNPAEYNPRKRLKPGDDEYERLKRSIETFGYVDPIIVNADGTVIGGHQRLFVLRDLGFSEADVAVVNLNKNDEKALNIALNKISGEWDEEKLSAIFAELQAEEYDATVSGFDDDVISSLLGTVSEEVEAEEAYTQKVDAPHYEIKGETPDIEELYSMEKTSALLEKIEAAEDVGEDEKAFLRTAAMRHVVFDYRNIAEYYASASMPTQRLMEESALVIVDFGDAIKNGFVRLREGFHTMMNEGEADGDEA